MKTEYIFVQIYAIGYFCHMMLKISRNFYSKNSQKFAKKFLNLSRKIRSLHFKYISKNFLTQHAINPQMEHKMKRKQKANNKEYDLLIFIKDFAS